MPDAAERLVNLAMYFDAAREPVTAEHVRTDVEGYPPNQDEAAFLRMFERDKDELRAAGLMISSDSQGRYSLDRDASFAAEISLSTEETSAVMAAGTAMLGDPAFPFADDLRMALAKLTESGEEALIATARLTDESPEEQGHSVAVCVEAASSAKRVMFGYTNSAGGSSQREIEPYGLFLSNGRWYLVGRDPSLDEPRTFAISRMSDLEMNRTRLKTPDFERPDDFDISSYVRLPFQFGSESLTATLRFDPDMVCRFAAAAGVAAEGHHSCDSTRYGRSCAFRIGPRWWRCGCRAWV